MEYFFFRFCAEKGTVSCQISNLSPFEPKSKSDKNKIRVMRPANHLSVNYVLSDFDHSTVPHAATLGKARPQRRVVRMSGSITPFRRIEHVLRPMEIELEIQVQLPAESESGRTTPRGSGRNISVIE